MNKDMTVGKVYSTTMNQPSGITEVLLEKAQKELQKVHQECEEQARLLGMGSEREARLITERDHYKMALEEISSSVDDWLNSLIQEPSLEFIHAIKAWADKKLKEIV